MMSVLAGAAVAVFGFMFAWSELIRELGGKRLSTLVSIVAALSMWLAFQLDPAGATDIVLRDSRELTDRLSSVVVDAVSDIVPSSAPSTPGPGLSADWPPATTTP